MRRWLGRFPWHPFLFALFPPLAFLAWNLGEMRVSEITRSILVCLLLAALLLLLFRALMGDWWRAALAASAMLLLLLTYGQLYEGLKEIGAPASLTRHRYLVPGLAVLAVAVVIGVRRMRSVDTWTHAATAMALILLIGPALGFVRYAAETEGSLAPIPQGCPTPTEQADLPDVYYIVLDAYERGDVLKNLNHYDNQPFLDALRARGFYVAEGSMSNYRHTKTSLAATLNMDFVQDFPTEGARSINSWAVAKRIRDNAVRRSLECLGYRTVALETGFPWTEWTDADYYIQQPSSVGRLMGIVGALTEPEKVFLSTTLVRAVTDGQISLGGLIPAGAIDPRVSHRKRVEFALAELGQLARLPSPKFVFVHIVSPHPPFVFGKNGEVVDAPDETTPGADLKTLYADQVDYLNPRVLEAIDRILNESEEPPIIVIMGDHGYTESNKEEKMSILNAYHLPGGAAAELYPTITPVNSFRLIMDAYFGGQFPLLPDTSYYSDGVDNFDYEVIPNTWSGK
jgi:hypothetical protein